MTRALVPSKASCRRGGCPVDLVLPRRATRSTTKKAFSPHLTLINHGGHFGFLPPFSECGMRFPTVLGSAGIGLTITRSWLADPNSQSNGMFYTM